MKKYLCMNCGSQCHKTYAKLSGEENMRGLGQWKCPKGCKNAKGKTPVRVTIQSKNQEE